MENNNIERSQREYSEEELVGVEEASIQVLLDEIINDSDTSYKHQTVTGEEDIFSVCDELINRLRANPSLINQNITLENEATGNILQAIVYGMAANFNNGSCIVKEEYNTINFLDKLVNLYKNTDDNQFRDNFQQALIATDSNGITTFSHINDLLQEITDMNMDTSRRLTQDEIIILNTIFNDLPIIINDTIQNQQTDNDIAITTNKNILNIYLIFRDKLNPIDREFCFNRAEDLYEEYLRQEQASVQQKQEELEQQRQQGSLTWIQQQLLTQQEKQELIQRQRPLFVKIQQKLEGLQQTLSQRQQALIEQRTLAKQQLKELIQQLGELNGAENLINQINQQINFMDI